MVSLDCWVWGHPFKVMGFPGGSVVKNLLASARDLSSIPGSGRSPGEGNGDPLQYSCLENPMGRGAWRVTKTKQQQLKVMPGVRPWLQSWKRAQLAICHLGWVSLVPVKMYPGSSFVTGKKEKGPCPQWRELCWGAEEAACLGPQDRGRKGNRAFCLTRPWSKTRPADPNAPSLWDSREAGPSTVWEDISSCSVGMFTERWACGTRGWFVLWGCSQEWWGLGDTWVVSDG